MEIALIVKYICITTIIIYAMSIVKSIHETRRAKAFEKMYKAERDRSFRPQRPPK